MCQHNTTLVNQQRTNDYDIDIGRGNYGNNHILNTDVGDDGWLGNPYALDDGYSREEAVEKYREAFRKRLEDEAFRNALERLRGKTLACWCKPKACHGDIILEYLRTGSV